MRSWTWTISAVLWLVVAPPVGADVVSDWNEAARAIAAEVAGPGPQAPPRLGVEAQVALAMFEAVNAIDRRFESYLGFPAASAAASQEAAAAVAAHGVLTSVARARGAALRSREARRRRGSSADRAQPRFRLPTRPAVA